MLVELEADLLALGEAVELEDDVWEAAAVPVPEAPEVSGAPVSVPVAVGDPEAVVVLLPPPVVVPFPTPRSQPGELKR